ncbi:acetyl esterase/lipase [Nitrospirillum viridazoti]|uniref:Acetyl esterase/lipase n=1 Tax=Nitrospirillum amazonense TaxID=28077 RepID=A0A560IHU5_9PROT|nr:acetyl esterase/lipase [Nitrospirillum amazonense]
MRRSRWSPRWTYYVAAAGLLIWVLATGTGAWGQTAPTTAGAAYPCYEAANPDDIRLWPGRAPGAVGDEPCRDIPFVQVFRAGGVDPGPALVLIPGGGYDHLSNEREQATVAAYFAEYLKITTFLLSYRLVQPDGTYHYPVPLWDGRRAVRLVRTLSARYGVDPSRIGVFGFSAGGHLAALIAFRPKDDFGFTPGDVIDAADDTVAALGLGYPVISLDPAVVPPSGSVRHLLAGYHGAERAALEQHLSAQTQIGPDAPPVFLFDGLDDRRVSSKNSLLLAQALRDAGVPNDIHLFDHGPHGAGLAMGITGEQAWPELFQRWLRQRGFLP